MSTPFAQIDGSATERIGGDQSWPLQAGPTAHIPAQATDAATQVVQPHHASDANAATQVVPPQYAPDANAATQVVQPHYAQPRYEQQYEETQYAQEQYEQPQHQQGYYSGPQQQFVDQPYQYVDQPYQYDAPQFPAPAYGAPAPQPQVWQIEEETERFVDHSLFVGQPAYADQPAFVPPPAAVAEHSARRRRNVWISLFTGVVVASAVLISGFFVLGRLSDAPASAVVGDCLARSGEGAVVVPCSDQQAVFTVLGRLDSRTQTEASMSACTGFTGTTDVYWQGKDDADARGLVLCLGPAKK